MALTNSQYDQIMRTYEDARLRSRDLLLARREEIAQILPELSQLDAEMAALSLKKARFLLGVLVPLSPFQSQLQSCLLPREAS